MPRLRRTTLVALTTAATLAATITPALPAAAKPPQDAVRVVATGLRNPRQLSVGPAGVVFVAEAGRGGSGPCIPNPEGGTMCLGATGAVTVLKWGHQLRVVTGLPSLAAADGSSASGPADVHVGGLRVTVAMGLGAPPSARAQLGAAGARLGTVLSGRLGGRLSVVADPAAYEAEHNPGGADLDTNPAGLVVRGNQDQYLVADAGANALESLGRRGDATVAAFADRMVPAPPFLGLPPGATIPMQSVPTDVVVGPDGAFYVSELTGFPFPAGSARILRVVPGRAPTVYASGLTNVTSLAWRGRTLYAVQLTDAGLLAGPPGSLRRVVAGGSEHPVVAGGLFMPYGVAVHGNTAYVSTCSTTADPIPGACPNGGEVRAVTLG